MKIRTGFVSNSSTSSFCIFGVCISRKDIREAFNLDEESDVIYDIGTKIFKDELEAHFGGEGTDEIYIGRSYTTIKDDETGKQFKDNVEILLKKYFSKDMKGQTHEEAWYN